jgi:PilZ domain
MLPRPEEARKNPRHRMDRAAAVVFGSPVRRLRCRILDMSDGGARLAVSGSIEELPRAFILVLFGDASVQRDCQIVWADKRRVGVKFTSSWYGINRTITSGTAEIRNTISERTGAKTHRLDCNQK